MTLPHERTAKWTATTAEVLARVVLEITVVNAKRNFHDNENRK